MLGDMRLYVRQLQLGPMKNFVYLVGAHESPEVCVIDPAWDVPALLAAADEDGKRIVSAFVTHHHGDHLNGVTALMEHREMPVYVQKAELDFSETIQKFGDVVRGVSPGEKVQVGPMEVTCIHTPGHTVGSQCLLCDDALVSGDTVFVNACGRCDLPGGDATQMYESLHHVLGALPETTSLYPGHDYGDVPTSSLARERANNPYFKVGALESFLSLRNRPRR